MLDLLHLPDLESLRLRGGLRKAGLLNTDMAARFGSLRHLEVVAWPTADWPESPLPPLLESLHIYGGAPPTFDQLRALRQPGPRHLPNLKSFRINSLGPSPFTSHLQRDLIGRLLNNPLDSASGQWVYVEPVTYLPRCVWANGWTSACSQSFLKLASSPALAIIDLKAVVHAELTYWDEVARYDEYDAALKAGAVDAATSFEQWKRGKEQ